MRKFKKSELEEFLLDIDGELRRRCTIVLIGGGAVGLRFEGTHATSDLDLWSISESSFWKAVEKVNARRTERIDVQKATIAQPPYTFEDRLTPLRIDGLSKLIVLVPEAHDLVLMKIARGEAHDLDAVEDINRNQTLSLPILIERYLETRSQVLGSLSLHQLNFLAAVARLFGEDVALQTQRRLRRR